MIDYDKIENIAQIIKDEIQECMAQQTGEDTYDNGLNHGYLTCLLKFNTLLRKSGLLS